MALSAAEKQVRQWLQTDDAGHLMTKVASLVRFNMEIHGIPLAALRLPASSSRHEIDEVIRSELAVFILENRANICEKIATPEIERGRVLIHTFINNHLLDKSRSSADQGGQRYLYKRFRDVLGKQPLFYLVVEKSKGRQWSLFSQRADNRKLGPLAEEDLEPIQWPLDLPYTGHRKDIKTQESLIRLAGWFWDEVVKRLSGQPVWIPLRDLVQWVDRFIPLSAMQTVSTEENPLDQYESSANGEAAAWHQTALIDALAVEQRAAAFADQLNDKQGQVYHLYYGEELTLEEIARQLGLKSASAAKYRLDQAEAVLQAFSRKQPLQTADGPDTDNEGERRFFARTLLRILKNRYATPY